MLHWFWRAFERREDVELIVGGPFFNDYIPWMYGIRLPQRYVKKPQIILPPQMARVIAPATVINSQLPWIPDLTLLIDAGWHTAERPKGKIVGLIKTDPHVLSELYVLPQSYCDVSFSMQQNYSVGNDLYLPYAYDPTVHYHEDLPIENDACLIGLQYPQRTELVNLLRSMGMKVHYSTGEIYDEYRQTYCKSKVALNWSTLQDLPARFWEAMGMGIPLVSNNVPDIKNFFVEGEDYLGFDNLPQAGRQFMRYIADPELAKKISESALKKVKDHTYDIRIEQILKDVKLL